jgi:tetratricopeptide (TPR) repeat protein
VAESRIDDLRRRLERDPGSRLFAQLAEELRRAGEVEEAISVAQAGLERHPAYPSARLTLGRALLDAGDAAAARSELESALRGAPDNILASRLLGEALESLGDVEAALARYRSTLEMAPGDGQVQGRVRALETRLGGGVAGGEKGPRAEAPGVAGGGANLPPTVRIRMPSAESRPRRAPLPPTMGETTGGPRAAPPAAQEAEPSPGGGAGPRDAGTPEEEEALPPTLPLGARTREFDPRTAGAGTPEAAVVSPIGTAVRPSLEVPGSESAPAGSPGRPLSSATLAELYFKQGLLDRASEVYRQVVEEEPGNQNARRRLAEIEADMKRAGLDRTAAAGRGEDRELRRRSLERTIQTLETLLGVIREGR